MGRFDPKNEKPLTKEEQWKEHLELTRLAHIRYILYGKRSEIKKDVRLAQDNKVRRAC